MRPKVYMRKLRRFPALLVKNTSMGLVLVLVLPLMISLYAWSLASEYTHATSQEKFKGLAQESEQALLYRMDTYHQLLLGGAGFFQGSDFVSRREWQAYAGIIDLRRKYPGMKGIGYIESVPPKKLKDFIRATQQDDAPHFAIRPRAEHQRYYIIKYIEPSETNNEALGMNIAFEPRRLEAAERAAESGSSAISRNIMLVRDQTHNPGFLLFYPYYNQELPTRTASERKAALRGWIFAPFIAHEFLTALTPSQEYTLNLKVYDGEEEVPENLIFSSNDTMDAAKPVFTIRKTLNVMQQRWTLVWSSTRTYEQLQENNQPFFILLSGLLFSGLVGVFFLLSESRHHNLPRLMEEKNYALPVVIFVLLAFGAYHLQEELLFREERYLKRLVNEKSRKIDTRITSQIKDRILAIKQMARRVETMNESSHAFWQQDARNYLLDLPGLRRMEWIDRTYHIRWVEPFQNNQSLQGISLRDEPQRSNSLHGQIRKDVVSVTPPLMMEEGYTAFIAYAPLRNRQKFAGFISGVFDVQEVLRPILTSEMLDNYQVFLEYEGTPFYTLADTISKPIRRMGIHRNLTIYDKQWLLKLYPTEKLVRDNMTTLPRIIYIAGLLIALFAALTVRYILISRQKNAQILDRQAALAASEETFRSAMEYASIGMALVDMDGNWLQFNPALCDICGFSEYEIMQKNFQQIIYEEDLPQTLENIRLLLSCEAQSYQLETRCVHKSGRIVWVLVNGSLVRNANHTPRYFVMQVQDITARREIDRMKTEFISTVSHELRTPLTSIRGALGLIEGGATGEMPPQMESMVHIAHKNSQRLVRILNDILDMEKIESGNMPINIRQVKLLALLQQALEVNEAYGARYGVRFTLKPMSALLNLNVMADPDRLLQVMTNLLSNAAKFSPKGAEVVIRIYKKDEVVRIEVSDSGEGIPEDFRSRIFSKFAQADSSDTRRYEGTGLGLSITKQLVERMGGDIGFESTPGKGTTFFFHLPLVKKELVSLLERIRHRVLICEDDSFTSHQIKKILEQKDYVADVAYTIPEAKRLLQNHTYMALILDPILPLGNGLDFLKEIRKSPSNHTLPVIVITDRAVQAQEHSDAQLEISAWISKPLIPDQLLSMLEQVMQEKEQDASSVQKSEEDIEPKIRSAT